MRVFRTFVFGAVLIAGASAHAEGISGTYVGKSNNAAFLVQIVQTSDGRLTGRYSQIILQTNGKLEEMNAAVTGASDGQTVALTIKPTELLSGSLSLSGTVNASQLSVTGGGYGSTLTLNLAKSDETVFRTYVSNLAGQAQRVNLIRGIEQEIPRVDQFTKQMAAFSSEVPTRLAKFPPIEQQYRRITELMRQALVRQRSIYGGGQASVARGQIAVSINQAGVEVDQIHNTVQAAFSELDSKSGTSFKQFGELKTACRTKNLESLDKDFALPAQWKSACLKLTATFPEFQKNIGVLRNAFVKIEAVWQEESAKQEQIIRSADASP